MCHMFTCDYWLALWALSLIWSQENTIHVSFRIVADIQNGQQEDKEYSFDEIIFCCCTRLWGRLWKTFSRFAVRMSITSAILPTKILTIIEFKCLHVDHFANTFLLNKSRKHFTQLPLKLRREYVNGKGIREETSSNKVYLVAHKFRCTRKYISITQIENRKNDQSIGRLCSEKSTSYNHRSLQEFKKDKQDSVILRLRNILRSNDVLLTDDGNGDPWTNIFCDCWSPHCTN